MIDELGPLLNNLPPKTAGALVQAVNRCSEELGVGPDWVRRWMGFTVVSDALARYAPEGQRVFELKGGAAIELRLGRPVPPGDGEAHDASMRPTRARATRDLDVVFRGELARLEDAVRDAFAAPRNQFGFRVEVDGPGTPFMRRFRIRLLYRAKRFGALTEQSFSNVKLEVSLYEGQYRAPEMVPAFSLKPFGLEGPEELPCLPLTKQIAQKLHAVTEPTAEGRSNDRFRDLLDIALLSAVVPPSPELRDVCEETFAIRKKHSWPPEVVAYSPWIGPLEERAEGMGLPHATAEAIVQHLTEYVRRISSA